MISLNFGMMQFQRFCLPPPTSSFTGFPAGCNVAVVHDTPDSQSSLESSGSNPSRIDRDLAASESAGLWSLDHAKRLGVSTGLPVKDQEGAAALHTRRLWIGSTADWGVGELISVSGLPELAWARRRRLPVRQIRKPLEGYQCRGP